MRLSHEVTVGDSHACEPVEQLFKTIHGIGRASCEACGWNSVSEF